MQYAEQICDLGKNVKLVEKIPPKKIRKRAFRHVVVAAYDSQCAASHFRISLPGVALIEAAHLIPFSESHDDDPRNGIALTPTYHRALDANLIAPGLDRKWKISSVLKDALRDNEPRYDLFRDLEDRPVLQPNEKYKHLKPKVEALEWRLDHLLMPNS